MFNRSFFLTAVAACLLLSASGAQAADKKVKVLVLSAVIKDKHIDGATVILQKNGQQSVTGATDGGGQSELVSPFGDGDDSLMIIKKDGYSPLVVKCPCDGLTYAISPVMTKLDGLRVVLNWGATPRDLDSHIAYPGNHIYWNHKTGEQANLDVDDTDGYGPETITIEKKLLGQKYVYGVHDFTDLARPASDNLSKSDAKVFVYIGQSLIKTYYVPRGHAGTLWVLFSIDERGEFHDLNTFIKAKVDSAGQLETSQLTAFIGGAGVAATPAPTPEATPAPAPASPAVAKEARRLNALGDKAHEAKQYVDAIDYFKQAVDLDPAYGQAYSNLAVSYFKANRIAEAIWANRKALGLAAGPKASNLRAASYYNIARIYEDSSDFASALKNYEWAQAERPVYSEAIERMKAKQH